MKRSALLSTLLFILSTNAYAGELHHKVPEQCASGCNVPPEALRTRIDDELLIEHMQNFAARPIDEESKAVDNILFYAQQSKAILEAEVVHLPPAHLAYLERQLKRDRIEIALRLIDDEGVVRAELKKKIVPLAQKQSFRFVHKNLPGLISSGTTVRTGANYLWTRL